MLCNKYDVNKRDIDKQHRNIQTSKESRSSENKPARERKNSAFDASVHKENPNEFPWSRIFDHDFITRVIKKGNHNR